MLKNNWQRVLFPICGAMLTALFATLFVDADSLWYMSLIKPEIVPPNIVFTIVWGGIYVLAAVSAVLVCMDDKAELIETALYLYAINGALTAFWVLLFFERHRLVSSLVCMIALIFSTMFLMRRVDKISGASMLLLLPYLIWLIFTLALNYAIAMLN